MNSKIIPKTCTPNPIAVDPSGWVSYPLWLENGFKIRNQNEVNKIRKKFLTNLLISPLVIQPERTVQYFIFVWLFGPSSHQPIYDTIIKLCLLGRDQIFSLLPRAGFEPVPTWLAGWHANRSTNPTAVVFFFFFFLI